MAVDHWSTRHAMVNRRTTTRGIYGRRPVSLRSTVATDGLSAPAMKAREGASASRTDAICSCPAVYRGVRSGNRPTGRSDRSVDLSHPHFVPT